MKPDRGLWIEDSVRYPLSLTPHEVYRFESGLPLESEKILPQPPQRWKVSRSVCSTKTRLPDPQVGHAGVSLSTGASDGKRSLETSGALQAELQTLQQKD